MPIRVSCQCGHSLSVPDNLAGKAGKCPKCQQVIKIPSASAEKKTGAATPAKANAGTNSKAAKPASPAAAPALSALDGLLESAGIGERKGKYCPNCDASVHPTATLCVNCGFNLSEGTKVEGHQVTVKKQFGDKRLNEAVDMMAREQVTEARLLNTGPPWWFLLAGLAGVLVFLAGALIKMDASTSGQVSSVPMLARIQAATMVSVLAASAGFGCLLVSNFAYLAILVTSFQESWKQGLLFFFVPFYNLYYMFSRIKSQRLVSTVLLMFVTGILAGVLLSYALPKI